MDELTLEEKKLLSELLGRLKIIDIPLDLCSPALLKAFHKLKAQAEVK